MSLLSWFDNRTLFGCQAMLAVMFAVLFIWMSSAYPKVRGVRLIALAFLAGIPCTVFMMGRGNLPSLVSITLANLFALISFLMNYEGIARFVSTDGQRKRIWLLRGFLLAVSAVSLAVVFYYSEVQSNIVPRIVVMAVAVALTRGAMAWELLRAQRHAPSGNGYRGAMIFLGIFMAVLAAFGLDRAAMTAMYGSPENFLQRNALQTSMMAMNVVYIAVFGLCFVILVCSRLIATSQEESERDLLSGMLNRRGIEARLLLELKRSHRSGHRLSVALVDIDHFKRINDSYGHAMGDAAIAGVAGAMARSLRDVDYLGRYGGDEFLVVLPETAGHHAALVGMRLRQAVSQLDVLGDEKRLTLSIGVTEASPEDDAISLIARADEALYQAKSDGRDCLRSLLPQVTLADARPTRPARVTAES